MSRCLLQAAELCAKETWSRNAFSGASADMTAYWLNFHFLGWTVAFKPGKSQRHASHCTDHGEKQSDWLNTKIMSESSTGEKDSLVNELTLANNWLKIPYNSKTVKYWKSQCDWLIPKSTGLEKTWETKRNNGERERCHVNTVTSNDTVKSVRMSPTGFQFTVTNQWLWHLECRCAYTSLWIRVWPNHTGFLRPIIGV